MLGAKFDLDLLDCASLCAISAPAEVARSSGISEMEKVPRVENRAGFTSDDTTSLKK